MRDISYITFYNVLSGEFQHRSNGMQARVGSSILGSFTICATLNSGAVQSHSCVPTTQYMSIVKPAEPAPSGTAGTGMNFAEIEV